MTYEQFREEVKSIPGISPRVRSKGPRTAPTLPHTPLGDEEDLLYITRVDQVTKTKNGNQIRDESHGWMVRLPLSKCRYEHKWFSDHGRGAAASLLAARKYRNTRAEDLKVSLDRPRRKHRNT